jgi:hypothetical protein
VLATERSKASSPSISSAEEFTVGFGHANQNLAFEVEEFQRYIRGSQSSVKIRLGLYRGWNKAVDQLIEAFDVLETWRIGAYRFVVRHSQFVLFSVRCAFSAAVSPFRAVARGSSVWTSTFSRFSVCPFKSIAKKRSAGAKRELYLLEYRSTSIKMMEFARSASGR